MSINVSDLLDENGNVDSSEIKSLTNEMHSVGTSVDATMCRRLRRVIGETDQQAIEVADAFGIGATTVRNHIAGECRHGDAPPTYTYDRYAGMWVENE